MFQDELAKCDAGKDLVLDIHSEGGSVFEGFKIGNLVAEWEGKTIARVNAAAFSIASYIAVRCDEVEIADNGFFMIHNPYSQTVGDAAAHENQGKLLAELKTSMIKTYAEKTGMDASAVEALMNAESYIGSTQAVEMGFADRVIKSKASSAPSGSSQVFESVVAQMFAPKQASILPSQEVVASPKEKIVSVPKPVAATVSAIKKAFPRAKSDFIVKCMEDEMSMEDVGEEYAKSMEDENETLAAKVTAMEEEIATLKAAMEEKPVAQAKATGSTPIANVGVNATLDDPRAKWNSEIEKYERSGMSRQKAVIAANRNNPGLRQQMLAQ